MLWSNSASTLCSHVLSIVVAAIGPLRPVGAQDMPRGIVLEKVVCKGDENQSYALYLPSHPSE